MLRLNHWQIVIILYCLFSGCAAELNNIFDYKKYADRFPYKHKDYFATTDVTQLGKALTIEEKVALFQSFSDEPSVKTDPTGAHVLSQPISIDSIDCFLFSDQGVIDGYSAGQKFHFITVYTIQKKSGRRSILWLTFAKNNTTVGSQKLTVGEIANRYVDSRVMFADQFENDSIYFTKGSEMIAPDLYKITEVSLSKAGDSSEVISRIVRTVPHDETIEDFQKFVNGQLVADFENTALRSKYNY